MPFFTKLKFIFTKLKFITFQLFQWYQSDLRLPCSMDSNLDFDKCGVLGTIFAKNTGWHQRVAGRKSCDGTSGMSSKCFFEGRNRGRVPCCLNTSLSPRCGKRMGLTDSSLAVIHYRCIGVRTIITHGNWAPYVQLVSFQFIPL